MAVIVQAEREMGSGGNYNESKQNLWFSSIIFVPFFPLRNKPTAYSAIVTSLGHYVMEVLSQNPKIHSVHERLQV
jgi:hypothetical protein